MIWQILEIIAGFICIVASVLCLLVIVANFRDGQKGSVLEAIVCAVLLIGFLLVGCLLFEKSIGEIQEQTEVIEFYDENMK